MKNKMKSITIFLALLVSIASNSQHLDSEALYNKIVLLRDNVIHKSSGTGFILTSNSRYWLVTAKHVADSLSVQETEVFFRDTLNKARSFKLRDLLHPNPGARLSQDSDFFIVELWARSSETKRYLERASLENNMLAADRKSINRKFDVLVFGYPYYDFHNFSPITFQSNLSSGLLNIKMPNMRKPFYGYLLENPSAQGFSGGPVLVGVKDRERFKWEKTLIIGIVTGTIGDVSGGKFAIITPSFHLLDLISN